MTKIESAIENGMAAAFKNYLDMTGYNLWHAPEHFIESEIARRIAAEDYFVFANASINKIVSDIRSGSKEDGPPKHEKEALLELSNARSRPDLTVFQKTNTSVIAAMVEIKLAYNSRSLQQDASKLKRIAGECKLAIRSGYLVAYSEILYKKTVSKHASEALTQKFDRWTEEIGWQRVASQLLLSKKDNACGYIILKERFT